MRSIRPLAVALLTAASLQWGCHGADTVTGPAPATYSISGTVSSDTVAVGGASLEILDVHLTASTETDGRYAFEGIAAGTYVITAKASGFESSARTVTVGPDAVGVNFNLHAIPPVEW